MTMGWDELASRAIGLFDVLFSASFCLNVNVKQFLHKHTQVCIQKKKTTTKNVETSEEEEVVRSQEVRSWLQVVKECKFKNKLLQKSLSNWLFFVQCYWVFLSNPAFMFGVKYSEVLHIEVLAIIIQPKRFCSQQ